MKTLILISVLFIAISINTNAQMQTKSMHRVEKMATVFQVTGTVMLAVGVVTANPFFIYSGLSVTGGSTVNIIRCRSGKSDWVNNQGKYNRGRMHLRIRAVKLKTI